MTDLLNRLGTLDPEDVDRLASKAAGLGPAPAIVNEDGDLVRELGDFEEAAGMISGLDDSVGTLGFRAVPDYLPPVSTDPDASARLCRAALDSGLGWPMSARVVDGWGGIMQSPSHAAVEYDEDEDGVGLLLVRWERPRTKGGRESLRGRIPVPAATPERAIALAVIAAGFTAGRLTQEDL